MYEDSTLESYPLYKQVHRKIVVSFDIFDGYTFRQLFEFYKSCLTSAPIFVYKDGFRTIRGNSKVSIVINSFIKKDNILKYSVDTELFNHKMHDTHIINMDLDDLCVKLKNIPKQGAVRLFQYEESDCVYCQIYGGSKTNDGLMAIKLEPYDRQTYEIDDEILPEHEPNAKVPLSYFCSGCESSIKSKCKKTELQCFPNMINCVISKETNPHSNNIMWRNFTSPSIESLYSQEYTKIKTDVESSGGSIYTVNIEAALLKPLSKLLNFNSKGIIKMYCQTDGIIKFCLDLGTMGEIVIHIIDKDIIA